MQTGIYWPNPPKLPSGRLCNRPLILLSHHLLVRMSHLFYKAPNLAKVRKVITGKGMPVNAPALVMIPPRGYAGGKDRLPAANMKPRARHHYTGASPVGLKPSQGVRLKIDEARSESPFFLPHSNMSLFPIYIRPKSPLGLSRSKSAKDAKHPKGQELAAMLKDRGHLTIRKDANIGFSDSGLFEFLGRVGLTPSPRAMAGPVKERCQGSLVFNQRPSRHLSNYALQIGEGNITNQDLAKDGKHFRPDLPNLSNGAVRVPLPTFSVGSPSDREANRSLPLVVVLVVKIDRIQKRNPGREHGNEVSIVEATASPSLQNITEPESLGFGRKVAFLPLPRVGQGGRDRDKPGFCALLVGNFRRREFHKKIVPNLSPNDKNMSITKQLQRIAKGFLNFRWWFDSTWERPLFQYLGGIIPSKSAISRRFYWPQVSPAAPKCPQDGPRKEGV